MGDHTTETFQQLQSRPDDERYARERLLNKRGLVLDEDSISWILNHIDCFVSQSQGNASVVNVILRPHAFNGGNYDVCDKIGLAIGNLQFLETLFISNHRNSYEDDDDEVGPVPIPDWEMVARILRHVRQNVKIVIDDERVRSIEEVQPFARAICGHPYITSLQDIGIFPYASLDTLFATLTTLPALESVSFGASEVGQAAESTLARPESLTELLRVPTLRFVRFKDFCFTRALCQATANALIEGTAFTTLEFKNCSFSAEESAAILANGLNRNTSVISITVVQFSNAQMLFDVLAATIPSNSTLRHLEVGRQNDDANGDDESDCL
jgi:hypothetical protein